MEAGKLVALTGAKTVGKTTIAKAVAALSDDVHILSFATPIRKMLSALGVSQHNLNVEKEAVVDGLNQSARQMLCSLGTDWGRNMVHPNIWLWAMDQQIAEIYRNAKNKSHVVIIIDDCRFANEAAWVAKKGGQIVELYRDGIRYTHEHITEKPLPNSLIDWSFDAGGVQNCVKNIVQNILAQ
jgi:energy-coupling factor transporter ATP-binding protein EcfA2